MFKKIVVLCILIMSSEVMSSCEMQFANIFEPKTWPEVPSRVLIEEKLSEMIEHDEIVLNYVLKLGQLIKTWPSKEEYKNLSYPEQSKLKISLQHTVSQIVFSLRLNPMYEFFEAYNLMSMRGEIQEYDHALSRKMLSHQNSINRQIGLVVSDLIKENFID
ncbi:MAG: hypothetical protein H6622_16025 [Halobacteriovoraceae bacterium]|nr:hypothetical protein [Halobacteriovoraceae bacterium]